MKEQNHHTRRASCWTCLIFTFILFYLTVSSLLIFSFTLFSLHHVFLGMSMLDLFVSLWSYWLLCVSYKRKEKLYQSKVAWTDSHMVLWPNLMHRTLRTIITASILAAKATINGSSEENIQGRFLRNVTSDDVSQKHDKVNVLHWRMSFYLWRTEQEPNVTTSPM